MLIYIYVMIKILYNLILKNHIINFFIYFKIKNYFSFYINKDNKNSNNIFAFFIFNMFAI